jgi:hypothetical protein
MKRQRIAFIGAGGMAREVESTLLAMNQVVPRFEFGGYVVSDLFDRIFERSQPVDIAWCYRGRHSNETTPSHSRFDEDAGTTVSILSTFETTL